MLAPHIKKKVDELWNRFWSAGLTNPLVAVEQITYLLFLKRLEDIDNKRVERGLRSVYALTPDEERQIATAQEDAKPAMRRLLDASTCRWSYIRQEKTNPSHLIDKVFPWLRNIGSRLAAGESGSELASIHERMADAYFQLDPNKGKVLSDAIDAIDQLFARAGEGNAAQDIMGDTFEYLLSEVATAGKNGQFRTPRHLIRFMVELLDPEPGQRVIDPAAGTGGFLFSTQQYLMRKYSAQDNVVLEWDGTPHRTDGARATAEQYAAIHNGSNFVGLDNDRTMARIGWMNLVLHDVTDPHLLQGDSLSKREGKDQLKQLLESETYDFVFANPPFTGTVDSGDLEPDSLLFPRVGGGGKKKNDAITNKSELLFMWLMLDLLAVGGRCAVIIPEGVLFGNADAHKLLRRELLTEHVVEAVISLPSGVFQPYTGVKTSILIFRKETLRDDRATFTGATAPRTEHVWFYEVEEDGYTKDAKRNARPAQQNDLWDALEKFKVWISHGRSGAQRNEKKLLQPSFHVERWRQALLRDAADQLTPAGEAFATLPDTSMWDGQVWAMHELFPELPADPKEAETQVRNAASRKLYDLVIQYFSALTQPIWEQWRTAGTADRPMNADLALADWQKAIKVPQQDFNRVAKEVQRYFEADNGPALQLWKEMVKDALKAGLGFHEDAVKRAPAVQFNAQEPVTDLKVALEDIAREVAMLDGFDVTLRSSTVDQELPLKAAKHWVVPVRDWARNDDWQNGDGTQIGSHDADGLVRPAYVKAMLTESLYDNDGKVKDGLLDPDCIEAREWNLSAGQYKPFDFTQLRSDKSVSDLIGALKTTEQEIIKGLETLLGMVEGRE